MIGQKLIKVPLADALQSMKDTDSDSALAKRCMTQLFALFFMKEFITKKKGGTVDWGKTYEHLEKVHHEMIANSATAAAVVALRAVPAAVPPGAGLEAME